MSSFWKNKTVFITGHTGFKGGWLSLYLTNLGAKVIGYSLAPKAVPNLFDRTKIETRIDSYIGDIRDEENLNQLMQRVNPDVVFHLAAQSIVRYSYKAPKETYETNVIGTLNVLEAIRSCSSVKAGVMVTTDKCYENKEWQKPYAENDRLGGHDPYSSSKACMEMLIASYRSSYLLDKSQINDLCIASVRSGNVIGGGDWSEDRLIPDIIRAFQGNDELLIRNPDATRPWMHVLEPLTGYIQLAEKLYTKGRQYEGAWNFGPDYDDVKPVKEIINKMIELRHDKVQWRVEHENQLHEATYLKLDSNKARNELAWKTKWSLNQALEKIIEWHVADIEDNDMQQICVDQIQAYLN